MDIYGSTQFILWNHADENQKYQTGYDLKPGEWIVTQHHNGSKKCPIQETWFHHVEYMNFNQIRYSDTHEWISHFPSCSFMLVGASIQRKTHDIQPILLPVYRHMEQYPQPTFFQISFFLCPRTFQIYGIRFIPKIKNIKSKL